jgi:hypothetical protein
MAMPWGIGTQMSKKHFEALVNTLQNWHAHGGFSLTAGQYASLIESISDACQRTNPNFQPVRFITACYKED